MIKNNLHVVVDEHLTFAGALVLELTDGVALQHGDTFDLFAGETASDTFNTFVLPTLSGENNWNTSELYSTGTITVVPEPAVIGLLSIGATLTLLGRRFTNGFAFKI